MAISQSISQLLDEASNHKKWGIRYFFAEMDDNDPECDDGLRGKRLHFNPEFAASRAEAEAKVEAKMKKVYGRRWKDQDLHMHVDDQEDDQGYQEQLVCSTDENYSENTCDETSEDGFASIYPPGWIPKWEGTRHPGDEGGTKTREEDEYGDD